MNIIDFLDELQGIYDDTGDPTDYGCAKEETSAFKQIAKNQYPGKPLCVVSDWKWLDVGRGVVDEGNSDEGQEVVEQHICARTILEDDANRGFNSVLTTPLQDFSRGCIFCTGNTVYILVGPGKRRIISYEILEYVSIRRLEWVLPLKPEKPH